MARLVKGELAHLRSVRAAITSLPDGKHMILVEDEQGQSVLKPEGGAVFLDLDGKRVTIIRKGFYGPVRVSLQKAKNNGA